MFYISCTYSEVTPESAEDGDTSDSGFEWHDVPYTYRELLEMIESNGYSREGADWLTTGYQIEDYSTLTERELSLHINRSLSSKRAIKLWEAL